MAEGPGYSLATTEGYLIENSHGGGLLKSVKTPTALVFFGTPPRLDRTLNIKVGKISTAAQTTTTKAGTLTIPCSVTSNTVNQAIDPLFTATVFPLSWNRKFCR
jgi:hypothetical protein